jgi:hypothetical protein
MFLSGFSFMRIVVFILIFLATFPVLGNTSDRRELKYLAPSTGTPPHEYYFTKVLTASLQKANTQYTLIPIAGAMQQKRLMASLDQGRFDVLWTMTSTSREAQAKPVRVPLTMGFAKQPAKRRTSRWY